MPTPAYAPLDPDKPSGPTQPPDAYSASDLANVRALRDSIITGAVQGWSYSQNPVVTHRPLERIWASGAFRLKMESTYGSTFGANLPLTVKWWWSNDAGVSYSQMGATANLTWDPTTFTLSAVDTNAGLWVSWLSGYMKARLVEEAFNTHVAAAGAAVHGLGTMATQNANAVNVTGGTLTGVGIGNASITGTTRLYPAAPPNLVNGVAWDWTGGGGVHFNAAPGIVIPNIAGCAPGEIKRIWVGGAGAITINSGGGVNFVWAQGHPVWSAGGGTLVNCVALAANTVLGSTIAVA